MEIHVRRIVLLIIGFITVISCTKQEEILTISIHKIEASQPTGSKEVSVVSNVSWKAVASEDWIKVTPTSATGSDRMTISWLENLSGLPRYGTVNVSTTNGNRLNVITITQASDQGALAALSTELSNDIIFSKNVKLYKQKNIMQGFDFTDDSHFYYSQAPSNTIYQFVSFCEGASKQYSDYMTLERFGHMTQIVAEKAADGKTYIWCNSNGQSTSSGYGNNWSFSRIEYKAGETYTGGYAGETFFLNKDNQYDTQVAIDFETRRLLVGSRKAGVSMRYFWIFDLDEVLALPLKTMECTVTIGSNSNITDDASLSQQKVRTVQARDLNDAKVLGYFEIPRGKGESEVYYYAHQGHEIHGDQVWFYEGNSITSGAIYYSVAYVTVYDYNGKVLYPRTAVKAIEKNSALVEFGFSSIGYAEAEGIKVKGDQLYLGFACHNGSGTYRYAEILHYDLNTDN